LLDLLRDLSPGFGFRGRERAVKLRAGVASVADLAEARRHRRALDLDRPEELTRLLVARHETVLS
jgi:hypothetical protein